MVQLNNWVEFRLSKVTKILEGLTSGEWIEAAQLDMRKLTQ